MDTSAVFEMFETINNKLDKQTNVSVESAEIDMAAVDTITEQFENLIKEVRKPAKVEHQHRHTIDIGSSKVFLSMVVMVFVILGLSYVIGEQRRSIRQYKDNDLKYRYVKMQGQTDEESLYRLERQFKYSDTIKIIRKQVERYEELLKEQTERIERAKRNADTANKIQKEKDLIKRQDMNKLSGK
jgi:hypothetical protein